VLITRTTFWGPVDLPLTFFVFDINKVIVRTVDLCIYGDIARLSGNFNVFLRNSCKGKSKTIDFAKNGLS
jgi:hypothetical protein